MKRLLLKITIKGLKWLKDQKKVNLDLNQNDKNDLEEWIEYLEKLINK